MPKFPDRLKQGGEVRVIAPSGSLSIISPENRLKACTVLEALGLCVSFGRYVETSDIFLSSSIEERLADLHDAFADPSVAGILTVIGGYNCNQLLPHIDYSLVARNPKVFCGFSDITVLQNAFLARADLVTYSGPHFSSFAMERGLEFTIEDFVRCLCSTEPYAVEPSDAWSDDPWYADQDQRTFQKNPGMTVLRPGQGEGRLVGGNLCTLNLLQGTAFMPSLEGTVLFVEEDHLAGADTAQEFDRNLESLLQLPDAKGIRAILIGRFQKRSEMTAEKLRHIIAAKQNIASIPVIADMDFGHTTPMLTLPVGARVHVSADAERVAITLLEH